MKTNKHCQHKNTHQYTDEKGTTKHCLDCRCRINLDDDQRDKNWRLFVKATYVLFFLIGIYLLTRLYFSL